MSEDIPGPRGKSAYDLALKAGFKGTLPEWLESLRGPPGHATDKGDKGDRGERGAIGPVGRDGKAGQIGPRGPQGIPGIDGDDGWSPILALVPNGARIVHKIVDWTGGDGTKPPVNVYLGPKGLVADIEDATDLRGPSGHHGGFMGGSSPPAPSPSVREVFYQDTDPVVDYPAINFKGGYFPAHPTIPSMMVYRP